MLLMLEEEQVSIILLRRCWCFGDERREADVLVMLYITEKSADGAEMDVVLEVMLDTTEKSAGGMEIDVVLVVETVEAEVAVDVAEVLDLEVSVVDVVLTGVADAVSVLVEVPFIDA